MTFSAGLVLGLWLGAFLCALFVLFVIAAVAHEPRAPEEQRDGASLRESQTPSAFRSSAPTDAEIVDQFLETL